MRTDNIEDEADFYEREIEKYMQESLDSTERSKRHLENSEKIGTQTAQVSWIFWSIRLLNKFRRF